MNEGRIQVLALLMFWLILPQGAPHGVEVDVSRVSAAASDVHDSSHLLVLDEIGSVQSECYVCFLAVEVVNPSVFGNSPSLGHHLVG